MRADGRASLLDRALDLPIQRGLQRAILVGRMRIGVVAFVEADTGELLRSSRVGSIAIGCPPSIARSAMKIDF